MSETSSKNFPSSVFKAFAYGYVAGKALGRMTVNFALEWALVFGLTLIVNVCLFHGRLDAPVAAFGIYALGLMVRMFARQRPVRSGAPAPVLMTQPVSAEDLAKIFGPYTGQAGDGTGASARAEAHSHL